MKNILFIFALLGPSSVLAQSQWQESQRAEAIAWQQYTAAREFQWQESQRAQAIAWQQFTAARQFQWQEAQRAEAIQWQESQSTSELQQSSSEVLPTAKENYFCRYNTSQAGHPYVSIFKKIKPDQQIRISIIYYETYQQRNDALSTCMKLFK